MLGVSQLLKFLRSRQHHLQSADLLVQIRFYGLDVILPVAYLSGMKRTLVASRSSIFHRLAWIRRIDNPCLKLSPVFLNLMQEAIEPRHEDTSRDYISLDYAISAE